jgi:hypothetical protein
MDKLLVATESQIESLKLLVESLESKKDKTDFDKELIEKTNEKILSLKGQNIVSK